jgi:hypothetical protein
LGITTTLWTAADDYQAHCALHKTKSHLLRNRKLPQIAILASAAWSAADSHQAQQSLKDHKGLWYAISTFLAHVSPTAEGTVANSQ